MNPLLVIMVALLTIALWFLLSFAFEPIGKFFYRIGKDAVDEINKEEKEKESNEER